MNNKTAVTILLLLILLPSPLSAQRNLMVDPQSPPQSSESPSSIETTSTAAIIQRTFEDNLQNDSDQKEVRRGGRAPASKRIIYTNNNQTNILKSIDTTHVVDFCADIDLLCPIEQDMDGDDKPECCTKSNNVMCESCMDNCINFCSRSGGGVSTCFTAEDRAICQCTNSTPTCYDIQARKEVPDTVPNVPDEVRKSNTPMLTYILLFVFGMAVLVLAVHFIHNTKD